MNKQDTKEQDNAQILIESHVQWEILPVYTITKATKETRALSWEHHLAGGESTGSTFRLHHPAEYIVPHQVIIPLQYSHCAAVLKYCTAEQKAKLFCTQIVHCNYILDAHN